MKFTVERGINLELDEFADRYPDHALKQMRHTSEDLMNDWMKGVSSQLNQDRFTNVRMLDDTGMLHTVLVEQTLDIDGKVVVLGDNFGIGPINGSRAYSFTATFWEALLDSLGPEVEEYRVSIPEGFEAWKGMVLFCKSGKLKYRCEMVENTAVSSWGQVFGEFRAYLK